MYRIYRKLEPGEFILAGGDCSQGGPDSNCCQFLSHTKRDIPIIYHSQGVAAQMTDSVFLTLEKIYDITGVPPTIGLERQMGGASEMTRLEALNRNQKYRLYHMPIIGKDQSDKTDLEKLSSSLGYDMNGANRVKALGDLQLYVLQRLITIYDKETIAELYSFIINKQGKAEARKGAHDDTVMALAIAWQMFMSCEAPKTDRELSSLITQLPTNKLFTPEGFY